jgi:uncharacterized membrane protein
MEDTPSNATNFDSNAVEHMLAKKVYSPTQVAVGSFLGGPVAVIYFLMCNFDTLEKTEAKNKVLSFGIIGIIALICLLTLLPENFPSLPFTISFGLIGKYVAENYQLKKNEIEASSEYDFHSNWRVFWGSLICCVGSLLVISGPLFVLALMGIIK